MRILSLLLLLVCTAVADSPFQDVLSLTIPEGEVARIEVDGEVIWPSIPYVTNGLIAYWDGIWNTGLGAHDPSTTVWKDLSSSGFDATQQVVSSGWHWAGDAYVGTSANGHKFKPHYDLARLFDTARVNHTIEIVSSAATSQRMTIFGGYSGYMVNFEYYPQSGVMNFRWYYNSNPNKNVAARMTRTSFAVCSTSANTYGYIDGVLAGTAVANSYSKSSTLDTFFIGGEGNRSNMSMIGEICAIRVYDRVLSADEIAHNAQIDAIRFGFSGN